MSRSGYAYVGARIRAMKSFLVPRESYGKLLKMGLVELAHFLEDNAYRKEIDELAVRYKGVNLIEYALMRNMARTFKKILKFSIGDSRPLISAYLTRWDVWNIKTVIRGKYARAPQPEIAGNLVPAGDYDEGFFIRIISDAGTVQDAVAMLEETPYYPALRGAMPSFEATGSLTGLEDALDRAYFEKISGVAEGKLAQYIALERDTLNLLTLLRLKKADAPVDKGIFLGDGQVFSREGLARLAQKDYGAIIQEVNRKFPDCGITAADTLSGVSSKLDHKRMLEAKRLLSGHKRNIDPILGYITTKKTEVDNLRLLTRGKHAGLPEELIAGQLIT